MIKYQLRCTCEHEFEGWFPSSKEYIRQKNKGMINCPMCDSTAVDKAIMAPAVKTSKKEQIPDDYFVMGESAEQILRKLNKKIKKEVRKLFGAFETRNLDFADAWKPLKAKLTKRLKALGAELDEYFRDNDLKNVLGS